MAQSIEEWFAQISGQVEALVLAYGAMAATHPESQKALALLASLAKTAAEQGDDSPGQKAYRAGFVAVVLHLAAVVELARKTRALDENAKH